MDIAKTIYREGVFFFDQNTWNTMEYLCFSEAYAAPPAPEDAKYRTQDLEQCINPFPAPLRVVKGPTKCSYCTKRILRMPHDMKGYGVDCDSCHKSFHLGCVGLVARPRYGSWLCPPCDEA